MCEDFSKMGIISFLSELLGRLLDKGPDDETDATHSKFIASIVDTLKSTKTSNDDTLQALRDLGAVVYIGTLSLYRQHLLFISTFRLY